ncbi:MAG: hypothetical protein AB2754_16160 [Candidatus Thiodiazotropha endolucinida]
MNHTEVKKMGETAENIDGLEKNQPTEDEIKALSEGSDKSSEGDAFDVIVEDPDSLPKSDSVPLGTFINQKRKWKEQAREAGKTAEALEAENQLLRMQLEQGPKQETLVEPTLESCGHDEERYQKERLDYMYKLGVEESKKYVDEQLSSLNQTTQVRQQEATTDSALDRHYTEAGKLKVSDFNDAEDKVIDLFGKEATQTLIANSERSHLLVYWLGKNPGKAAYYANLIKTQPLKGAMALGELEAKLKTKPKSDKPPAEPDTPLDGASTPTDTAAWKRRLDKIRDDGGQGCISKAIELKKEAARAGITLE